MSLQPLTGKALRATQLATASINIYEGSVRSGKTIGSLIKWLEYVRHGPAGNLIMVGKTERTLKRNVIDPLIEMVGPKLARFVSGSGELFLLGRRIYVAGANDERAQDKIRGLTLAGAYVDEATTLPESFWSMLLTRFSVEGARLFATTNPDGPRHWLKTDYLDRACLWLRHDGSIVRPSAPADPNRPLLDLHRLSFRLQDNPNLPPSYVENLRRTYTGLWRRRYIDGDWVLAEGVIYDSWDEERHLVDADQLPNILEWFVGVDYGTTNPFSALLLGVGADRRMYVVSEFRYDSAVTRRSLTDAEYSARLLQWLDSIEVPRTVKPTVYGVRPRFIAVDPSAASFTLQLYRDGLQPTKARNSVLDGIRVVHSLLTRRKLLVVRGCTGLINEIPAYSWDKDKADKGEDVPIKLDDHSVDALRYGVFTTEVVWRPLLGLD